MLDESVYKGSLTILAPTAGPASPRGQKRRTSMNSISAAAPHQGQIADQDRADFDPMWPAVPQPCEDGRQIGTGRLIPTDFYADQPFLTPTHDGGLLCVVTTGTGHEGSRGQHVLTMKTFDGGVTWQNRVPLESPQAPESSWGVPITMPSGRIFVFYVFNADDTRELPADNPPYPGSVTQRMDSHGHYVFRWSDDQGKTWSHERGVIPVREFEIDRNNATGGSIRFFWNVGKPFLINGSLFLPIHKVGGFGEGWFTSTEGALLRSDDLSTCQNPQEANWVTLPDGDYGIRAPIGGGPVAEEHSFAPLSDGSIFTVFRTIDGHPACSYSRNQGRSWEPSEYMRFANGRLMKHPRAATFVWKLPDGGYLYCFHNHGGKALRDRADRRTVSYTGRNPMWFCRGWETDSPAGKRIAWSQPEIGIYDDDPLVRISYPDCLEHDGRLLFTETQKHAARIHTIPPHLADALSAEPARRLASLASLKPILEWSRDRDGWVVPMPELPRFVVRDPTAPYGGRRLRSGFAIRLGLRIHSATPRLLLENAGDDGSALRVLLTEKSTLRIELDDGETAIFADSDPVASGPELRSVTVNVDGGSNTISFFQDGILDDGGDARQYGWSRFSPYYRNEFQGKSLVMARAGNGTLEKLALFGRVLLASEIAGLDMEGSGG